MKLWSLLLVSGSMVRIATPSSAVEPEITFADAASPERLDLRPLLTDFFPSNALPDADAVVLDASMSNAREYTMVPLPPAGVGFAVTAAGFIGVRLIWAIRRRSRH